MRRSNHPVWPFIIPILTLDKPASRVCHNFARTWPAAVTCRLAADPVVADAPSVALAWAGVAEGSAFLAASRSQPEHGWPDDPAHSTRDCRL